MNPHAQATGGDDAVRNRVVLLFVAGACSVVALYRHSPASRLWLPAALAGIAVAIWHGAYDTVLAEALWQPRYGGRWLLPFVAWYAALAALVVLLWWAFPVVALAAFLLYSGVHFGMETEHDPGALQRGGAIALGCLPTVAACHWQAAAVLPILVTMLRGESDAAAWIVALAGTLFAPCLLLAMVPPGRRGGGAARRVVLVLAQLLLFRFCPPVLAFAVFFCLLHTPEHLIETSRGAAGAFHVASLWRNLRAGLVPWLLSLAAIAAAGSLGRRSLEGYTASVLIALSALTVPHMALGMLAAADARRRTGLPFGPAPRVAHP